MIHPGLVLQNRYRIVRKIGEGGFGETFEVDDRGTRKVLKVLNLDNFTNLNKKKVISLFQREADVLKLLNHPGIPKVDQEGYFTWLNEANKLFHCLVMENFDGNNLEDWVQQRCNQIITQEQAIDWLEQLVKILEYLHDHRYFHRDIKPNNIILKPNTQLALVDFGTVREITGTYLAKLVDEIEVTKLVSAGYTPLEQINGKAVLQSDFFALGRTFVYLVTGQHPTKFVENDLTGELIWRHSATQISPEFADLIDWMMAAFPRERPANTQVILQRLAEIQFGGVAQVPVVFTTKKQRIERWNTISRSLKQLTKDRKAFIGVGIAATAAIAVIFPIYILPQRQSTAPLAQLSLVKNFSVKPNVVDEVASVAFSPDGQTLVRGSYETTTKILDWRTGKVLQTFSKPSSKVWSTAISPNGRLLVTGHWEDTTIKLWELGTGKLLRILKGHTNDLRSVAFSPDGQTLASGGHDKTIKLWRVSTGELLHTFSGHTENVTSVAFSPDGRTLASASDDKTIKLWNLDNMKLVRTLTGHSGQVLSVTFSPDGETLASGSGEDRAIGIVDNTIKLWNPKTGELRRTLAGHYSWVWCLAISPDGKYIASGSYDNSIKLWNLRTGEELQTLKGHSNWVWSVAFSPDGQTLASGGVDSAVKIWSVYSKAGQSIAPNLLVN